jgi:hypothetical protein
MSNVAADMALTLVPILVSTLFTAACSGIQAVTVERKPLAFRVGFVGPFAAGKDPGNPPFGAETIGLRRGTLMGAGIPPYDVQRKEDFEMRTVALIAALALAGVPTGALAAQPSHPSTPASTNANSQANATSSTGTSSKASSSAKTQAVKVLYVLRGTIAKYTAVSGTTNGSVAITVKSANFDAKTLKGMTLTFAVSPSTKVSLHSGKPIASGDNGIVKVRAPKHSSAVTLQTLTAFQVIDQGASA